MLYLDCFNLADDTVAFLDTIVVSNDPFVDARCAGLAAVAGVCAYELAIKEIFISFAHKKHKVFGAYTNSKFDRINGQIKRKKLSEYALSFGAKYEARFKRLCDARELEMNRSTSISIKSAYSNLITWRNEFAHGGQLPRNATYAESKGAFADGKHVVHCLAKAMVR